MRETINRMRERGNDDRGFTMIELLVVVVIIGVLVAIAVPVYLNYRKGAANKSAAADVRSAITAIEQYYTENGNTYPTAQASASEGDSVPVGTANIQVSPGNILAYSPVTVSGTAGYKICARNTDGGQMYSYNSVSGGGVKKAVTTFTTVPNCAASAAD